MNDEGYQTVEGFESIVASAAAIPVADYRGPTTGWFTPLWWKSGPQENLAWLTAPCPQQRDTVFCFVGVSANLPYGYVYGNKAELSVNGEHALDFDLGIRRPAVWKGEDLELEFIPESVATPFEGYHRHWEMPGNSGLYRLSVPARLVEPGKGVRIGVALRPQQVDYITWFAVTGRKDTLQQGPETLAQELAALKTDYLKLKNVTNALARMVYRDHFPDSSEAEHAILWTHEKHCVMKPDVLKLDNGDLLLAFREGPEHVIGFTSALNGRVCAVRSSDGGRTWSEHQVVSERDREDHRDPSMMQLRDGTVLMHYMHSDRYDPVTGAPLPTDRRNYHIHVLRSFDGGHSWEKEPIEFDHAPFATAIAECKCLELPGGRILMPLDNVAPKGAPKSAAVFASNDRGSTWQYLSTIGEEDVESAHLPWPCEPSLARTRSGRIVAVMRTQPPRGGNLWQSFSDDDGVSWSTPREIPLFDGGRGDLLVLSDGRLLCSIGYRGDFGYGLKPGHPESATLETNGIRVSISEDEGETWGPVRVLRDDMPNTDMGYPVSVELDGGRMLTVYWYHLFGRYFIAGTRWNLPPASRDTRPA